MALSNLQSSQIGFTPCTQFRGVERVVWESGRTLEVTPVSFNSRRLQKWLQQPHWPRGQRPQVVSEGRLKVKYNLWCSSSLFLIEGVDHNTIKCFKSLWFKACLSYYLHVMVDMENNLNCVCPCQWQNNFSHLLLT